MLYDVVVVGGGPVGCMTAHLVAKSGFKTLVVEEHKEIGKPVHCAGKICVKAFEEFNLPENSVVNKVRGAYLYSPSNYYFRVSKHTVESYIVDREVFDKKIAQLAENAGAEILTSTRCFKVEKDREKFSLKFRCEKNGQLNTTTAKCKVVVDAEGWRPMLLKNLGIKRKRLKFLAGFQADMEDVEFNRQDHVEVYFGRKFFPGFFGWLIPLSSYEARVGLCVNIEAVKKPPSTYFKLMLKNHSVLCKRIKQKKIKRVFGGIIPIHGPLNMEIFNNFFVVGDAAGHVKSTTGGGVYVGLKMAKIVSKKILHGLGGEEVEKNANLDYWKTVFDVKFTSFLRRFLDKLSDEELDYIFKVLGGKTSLLREIEEKYYSQQQFHVFLSIVKNIGICFKFKSLTPKMGLALLEETLNRSLMNF